MKKTMLSWSSGKDSAYALHLLRQDQQVELLGLFTVVNEKYGRVSMHSTRLELLKRQAAAAGLPLSVINIPHPCSIGQCDSIMARFTAESERKGIEQMAFGDIFLEEIRKYRENQLRGTGIQPLFPLWGMAPGELAEKILAAGVEAYISCVNPKQMPAKFAGRKWTRELIAELPPGVDPCGENGEFHTVVVGGPMFSRPIRVAVGEIVEREGFVFADIVPKE